MSRLVCLFRGHQFAPSHVIEEGPYRFIWYRCLRCRTMRAYPNPAPSANARP